MSVFDKAKDKAEQAIGAAKEKLGEKTGNQDLANSGRADQTEGQVKETGHDLRDRAEGGVQELKDKFNQ
ncbi:hypothetical protein SD37_02005 [Amycolatopsis orientalis]|uniref:CsbD-like domain-containing protein n=1 Tax=Amycolatopsis orientalis TaxID=31958 RepID=A0A193BQS0_AMYOR|nr:CsbD family protein [Amycolatopsis orientalis]ANN14551.1 hypothetical protein SD37_02005 [Amycolatopsis orientalis]